jgi:putative membrane protein
MSGPEGEKAGHLSEATELALARTRLAYERTLLAWVRTATGLITFGFSLYKFFQYQRQEGIEQPHRLLGPREFAILMIGTGLIALLLATIEHTVNIRMLRKQYGHVQRSLAGFMAALISLLGLIGLLAAIFNQ